MTAAIVEKLRAPQNQTRKEEAYNLILEIILKGGVKDSDYLSEKRLAEAFGMSRAPIREALHALCTERIMESVPRSGYRVAPISLREIMDCIDVRFLLEKESVRRSCLNRTPEALAKLDDIIDRYDRANKTEEKLHLWISRADSVHLFLAEMSGNIILVRSIAPIIDLTRRASIQLIHDGRLKPKDQTLHLSILKAVREGDIEKAQSLMHEDILVLKNTFLSQ
ncbi:MAG: GntR family transcriptional regulator [Treponemataceae bacterium]